MVVVFVDMCSSGESSGYIQTQCNKIRGKIHSQNDRKTKLHMQIIRSLQPNRNNQIHSIFCFVLFSNYEISTKHYICCCRRRVDVVIIVAILLFHVSESRMAKRVVVSGHCCSWQLLSNLPHIVARCKSLHCNLSLLFRSLKVNIQRCTERYCNDDRLSIVIVNLHCTFASHTDRNEFLCFTSISFYCYCR